MEEIGVLMLAFKRRWAFSMDMRHMGLQGKGAMP